MDKFNRLLNDNSLENREHLQKSLLDLLSPLGQYYTGGGLDLGSTGAHYSPRVASMEGWSRILWGLAPLVCGGGEYSSFNRHLEILRRGTNPSDAAYWGNPPDTDQRLVEMATIALSLMIAPSRFWEPLSEIEKHNVYTWLATIQERQLPANNWHFFRILVCSAFRTLSLPVNEKAEAESFDMIESCYRGDGWYVDGSNGNYDLYNPFAFHFYGLIYAKVMGGKYSERAQKYIDRAKLFAPQYVVWFREDGSIVPYGRSLTYRFAAVSFFSACAFAGVEVLPWGTLKGIVLRHLRWWYSRPILDHAGILSVGYGYPNLVMAEQYNSPGSPYWALKSYLVLALAPDHPFWQAKETALPELSGTTSLKIPSYIISRTKEDVQLLCPGRYSAYEAVHAAAKYCKFVYSARFGFSVSHGSWGLEKTGCDSTLLLSEGDGYWRERRHSTNQICGANWTSGQWKPWDDVVIKTALIALGAWHIRIHRIQSGRTLETAEGGFSVPRYRDFEHSMLPEKRITECPSDASVSFPWAATRIVDLSPENAGSESRKGDVILLEPNLNILEPSGMVPILRGTVRPGVTIISCAVRAGDPLPAIGESVPAIQIRISGSLSVQNTDGSVIAEIPDWE